MGVFDEAEQCGDGIGGLTCGSRGCERATVNTKRAIRLPRLFARRQLRKLYSDLDVLASAGWERTRRDGILTKFVI